MFARREPRRETVAASIALVAARRAVHTQRIRRRINHANDPDRRLAARRPADGVTHVDAQGGAAGRRGHLRAGPRSLGARRARRVGRFRSRAAVPDRPPRARVLSTSTERCIRTIRASSRFPPAVVAALAASRCGVRIAAAGGGRRDVPRGGAFRRRPQAGPTSIRRRWERVRATLGLDGADRLLIKREALGRAADAGPEPQRRRRVARRHPAGRGAGAADRHPRARASR